MRFRRKKDKPQTEAEKTPMVLTQVGEAGLTDEDIDDIFAQLGMDVPLDDDEDEGDEA